MKKNKKNKIITTIAAIIAVVLMMAAVGVIVVTVQKTPISVDGKAVKNNETLSLITVPALDFAVNGDYTVKILPNTNEPNFEYIVGNDTVSHYDIDYTRAFLIKNLENGFRLSAPYAMNDALNLLFPDEIASAPDDIRFLDNPYFVVLIEVGKKQYSFPLYANFGDIASDVALDKEIIVF